MNPQDIKSARHLRQSHQRRLLYALDERGQRAYNDAGEQYLDPDRIPVVLDDVGVPPALCAATFASSPFSEMEEARSWYTKVAADDDSARRLALFFGPGANHTAAAVMYNAVKRGKSVAWSSWHEFLQRYTEGIDRSRVLAGGLAEEMALAAQEIDEARYEDFRLRYVYEVLVIVDLDLDALRDFSVPDIISMFRNRSDYLLTTVLTVSSANSPDFERNADLLGKRGALLRLLEDDAVKFDGR
jgi:hypothetical protein